MGVEKINTVQGVRDRITELAGATGAQVQKNTRGTTNAIANNGNL